MSTYFEVVIQFSSKIGSLDIQDFDRKIMENYSCQGIEEFNMEESTVDEILGDKSYCGGDVTPEILSEIEQSNSTLSKSITKKYYFNDYSNSTDEFIKLSLPDCFISVAEKENEDWNSNWKESFQKIKVDDSFYIVPSWEEKINTEDILIYPGMGLQ
jgi:ribosomal protein L11 methyltransferase